jgi:hypothetical protein
MMRSVWRAAAASTSSGLGMDSHAKVKCSPIHASSKPAISAATTWSTAHANV